MHVSRRSIFAALCLLPSLYGQTTPVTAKQPKGRFSGRILAEWLDDGRSMRLAETFEYISHDGRRWPVPEGTVVDGASIPRIFWSLIGSPFAGLYRAPSVVHDYYCEIRTRPDSDVHAAFYEAMLLAGVGSQRAWLMFEAVSRFGPRWEAARVPKGCEVIGPNYDFESCAQNFQRPKVVRPKIDTLAMKKFLETVSKDADPKDIEILNRATRKMK